MIYNSRYTIMTQLIVLIILLSGLVRLRVFQKAEIFERKCKSN